LVSFIPISMDNTARESKISKNKNMTRIVKITALGLILSIPAFFLFLKPFENQLRTPYHSLDQLMEDLNIPSNSFTKDTVVIVFFNSECDLCQQEFRELTKYRDSLSKVDLQVISNESEEKALDFLVQFGFSNSYQRTDPEKVVEVITGGIPQIFIYTSGNLYRHFEGITEVGEIMELLP